MSDDEFYQAFSPAVLAAGLELRDHWHRDDISVTYKLREPRSGKTMRYTIKYADVADRDAGARMAAEAVARFFGSQASNPTTSSSG